jgi:sugar phosphate isomerase/epimerase
MSTGMFYWFGYKNIDPAERIEMIKTAGFDNVLLWWGDDSFETEGPRGALAKRARQAGLYVENAHINFDRANAIWLPDDEAEPVMRDYLRWIEEMGECEIPCGVFHVTNGQTPPPPNEQGIERLALLAEAAEKANMYLALENLRNPEYLDYIFDKLPSNRLQFCYDSGHEMCRTNDRVLIERHAGRIMCLHLHDNMGMSVEQKDEDDMHLPPGEGIIDWLDIMRRLKAVGYTGPVSLECSAEFSERSRGFTAEAFLRKMAAKAREFESMLIGVP